MASLTGQSVASSYEQLLHVDRDGGGNGTTLVDIKDGDNGTTFALQLATDKINVKGNNGNASHSLLKIHNNDDPSNSETGQTADIDFFFQGTTNGGSSFVTKNAGAIRAGKDSDYFTSSADNMDSNLKFYTAQDNVNTLALTLDSNQVVELNNGQLKFPASQNASSDANTLDDYEEGTYTATATPGTSGSITLDSNANELSYVKIGSQVTVNGLVYPSSVSSPVGFLKINLPFSIGDKTDLSGRCSGSVTIYGSTANISDFVLLGVEGDLFVKIYLGDATSLQSDSANAIDSDTSIAISVTYFV